MRQVVLDTETTGLEAELGHRVIEVGAVELINRKLTGRHYHKYLNPQRAIDAGAQEIHGLSAEFLADKPVFADIAAELLAFIQDAELVIHNAPFDVNFLEHEYRTLTSEQRTQIGLPRSATRWSLTSVCEVKDSLALARHKHPGQKNNLDALCRRYDVDNSSRTLHGALLDAEILADVYLLMTGGQTALFDAQSATDAGGGSEVDQQPWTPPAGLLVISPSTAETTAHSGYLDMLDKESGGSVWRGATADS